MTPIKTIFSFAVISLLCVVGVIYYPALKGFFVSDDFDLINAVRTQGPWGIWTVQAGFFRPVIALSLYFDYSVWGLNPIGYKVTNVVTHALNSILVMLSVWLMTSPLAFERQTAAKISAVAGMIFAVLPAHAEAVAWISGRTDVICTFFGLWAWCAFLAYEQNHKLSSLVISAVGLALALLSKEASLTLPIIMGAYSGYLYFSRRAPKWALIAASVNTCMLFLYLPLRYIAVGGLGGYGANVHLNFEPVRWIAGPPIFVARTIWPCCWPVTLLPDTARLSDQVGLMRWFYLGLGLIFIASVSGGALTQIYQHQTRAWGLSLFMLFAGIIGQLPSITIGLQTETRIGERLVYLPSVFISGLIALLLGLLLTKHYQLVVSAFVVAVIYGVSLWQANVLWYQAGEIARSVLASMRAIDVSRPVRVILPDHLQGAFIFRNGLQSASAWFAIPGDWHTLGWVTLATPFDRFELEVKNGQYSLTVPEPNTAILSGPASASLLVSADNRLAQITVDNGVIAYYSQGRLQTVP